MAAQGCSISQKSGVSGAKAMVKEAAAPKAELEEGSSFPDGEKAQTHKRWWAMVHITTSGQELHGSRDADDLWKSAAEPEVYQPLAMHIWIREAELGEFCTSCFHFSPLHMLLATQFKPSVTNVPMIRLPLCLPNWLARIFVKIEFEL